MAKTIITSVNVNPIEIDESRVDGVRMVGYPLRKGVRKAFGGLLL